MTDERLDLAARLQGAGSVLVVGSSQGRLVVGCEAATGFRPPTEDFAVKLFRIWDLESRSALGPWIADDDGVEAAAVGDLDGRPVVACAGRGGKVRIWSSETADLVDSLDVGGPWVQSLAMHDHGEDCVLVVSTGDRIVQAWSLRSGEPLTRRFGGWNGFPYAATAGSIAGDPVIAVSDHEATLVWSLDKQNLVHRLPSAGGTGYALDLGTVHGRSALVSIREGKGAPHQDQWGTNTTYSFVTMWDLSAETATTKHLAYRMTRARGVALADLSGRVAVASFYHQGVPFPESDLYVWYPDDSPSVPALGRWAMTHLESPDTSAR